MEVLHGPLRDEEDPGHERDGKKDADDGANGVDPEAAEEIRLPSYQSPDQGDRDRHADGAGKELLDHQGQHLGQMAHRRLARVGLPVRPGQEADRRVEGEAG